MPPQQDLSSLLPQYSEEVPVTSLVFEGHLYLRTDKKQWQWRLFRFDGSSFTCLSAKKVKLPPNTLSILPLESAPAYPDTPVASYYQLPKFTVTIANISAISLLRKNTKNSTVGKARPALYSSQASKCFCIRTYDGHCYVMKAQKQKDLERWLFVLTKMWSFTHPLHTYPIPYKEQAAPLVSLSLEKMHWIEEWRKSLAQLIAYDPNITVCPPPIESIPDDDQVSVYSGMTSVSHK
ncbi:hypothetical protein BDF14DRAFT_1736751, partial [Spinellus fusiger]